VQRILIVHKPRASWSYAGVASDLTAFASAAEVERVMRTLYRIDDFQEVYFVIDDFEDLLDLARVDFGPSYQRIKGQPELDPGAVLLSDIVFTRGTGTYHQSKRKPSS
jgi:phenylalanine-4-hydroxylase